MHTYNVGMLLAAALLLACQRDAELPTAAPDQDLVPHQAMAEARKQRKAQLERLSGMPMLMMADRLRVTEIRGKSIKTKQTPKRGGRGKRLGDVPVADHPTADENEPAVATNPKAKKRLVAGYHFITDIARCHARRSSDGGRTWSAPVVMPQLTGESECSDPVVAYSPDGSRVFYAYMDLKFFIFDSTVTTDFDILVSYSDDDGATWVGPFIALQGVQGVFDYDKPWIGTPDDASSYVYVTATRFDAAAPFACSIVFTRSVNKGSSYGPPQTLDASPGACGEGASPVVQGSRPAGGKRGSVLVAWYHSGTDGWLTGSFHIRTRHSADYGSSFGPVVDAVTDASETPFWKGPFNCYERWWGSMFPDVELDPKGGGHIAYTHDPAAGNETAEVGDIRYVRSAGAPHTSWSAPRTVNDDGTVSAQGYVAIDIKSEGTGQSAKPHATWEDHRLPLEAAVGAECPFFPDVENLEYDIFYSTRRGSTWSPNVRVSDRSSRSDFIFNGDYIDLTTTTGGLFTIWTDRRDKSSIMDLEDDVWGSRTHRVQVAANP